MQNVHYGTHPTTGTRHQGQGQRQPYRQVPLGGSAGRAGPPVQHRMVVPGAGRGRAGPAPNGSGEIIFHPALFGPRVATSPAGSVSSGGGITPQGQLVRPPLPRPVPNVMPRNVPGMPAAFHQRPQRLQYLPGASGKMPAPPPPQPPRPDPFVEEQMEILADKVEGLEGELRYAWRALDVLSQEYIKMWQRLEKMEGLLGEQQTVISQLIDLYSVDSSDNQEGKSGGGSPSTGLAPRSSAIADEDFYKALNQMHGDSSSDRRIVLSGSQSLEDFVSGDESNGHAGNSNNGVPPFPLSSAFLPPNGSPRASKQGTFSDFMQYDAKAKKAGKKLPKMAPTGQKKRKGSQGSPEESDFDAKSMTSSVRSTQSGTTVRSEDPIEFPTPSDLSPGYDNITPPDQKARSKSEKKKLKKQLAESAGESIEAVPPGEETRTMKRNKSKQQPQGERQLPIGGEAEERPSKSKLKGKPKDQEQSSPLTMIGGKYSFSLSDETSSNTATSASQQVAGVSNGKPLFQSMQTAMKPTVATVGQQLSPSAQANNGKNNKASNSEKATGLVMSAIPAALVSAANDDSQKNRKLSIKEKRKLRAERELASRDSTKDASAAAEQAVMQQQQQQLQSVPQTGAGISPTGRKADSSESDQSMRSDQSVSPKPDIQASAQSGSSSNNNNSGSSSTEGQLSVQLSSSNKPGGSREFAVSRALGKYRKQQRSASSNSDSQEDLDVSPPGTKPDDFHPHLPPRPQSHPPARKPAEEDDADIEAALKNLDAKLAEIEGSAKQAVSDFKTPDKLGQQQVTLPEKTQQSLSGSISAHAQQQSRLGLTKQESSSSVTGGPVVNRALACVAGQSSRLRQSTEESIDPDDEWYQHEMRALEELEYERLAGKIRPPKAVEAQMSLVLGELCSKVPLISKEVCDQNERERKKRQDQLRGRASSSSSGEEEIEQFKATKKAQGKKREGESPEKAEAHEQRETKEEKRKKSMLSQFESSDVEDDCYEDDEAIAVNVCRNRSSDSSAANLRNNQSKSIDKKSKKSSSSSAVNKKQQGALVEHDSPRESSAKVRKRRSSSDDSDTQSGPDSYAEEEDSCDDVDEIESHEGDLDEVLPIVAQKDQQVDQASASASAQQPAKAPSPAPAKAPAKSPSPKPPQPSQPPQPPQPPQKPKEPAKKAKPPQRPKVGLPLSNVFNRVQASPFANVLTAVASEGVKTLDNAITEAAAAAEAATQQQQLPPNQPVQPVASDTPVSQGSSVVSKSSSTKSQESHSISKATSASGGSLNQAMTAATAATDGQYEYAEGDTAVAPVEGEEYVDTGFPDASTYDAENGEAAGGYYDENGEWIEGEASGYYDENGDWVETGWYYDENGECIEYAGYYDENGEWVEVEPPASYYEGQADGEWAEDGQDPEAEPPPDEGGGGDQLERQQQQPDETGSFLAVTGVAASSELNHHPQRANDYYQHQALSSYDEDHHAGQAGQITPGYDEHYDQQSYSHGDVPGPTADEDISETEFEDEVELEDEEDLLEAFERVQTEDESELAVQTEDEVMKSQLSSCAEPTLTNGLPEADADKSESPEQQHRLHSQGSKGSGSTHSRINGHDPDYEELDPQEEEQALTSEDLKNMDDKDMEDPAMQDKLATMLAKKAGGTGAGSRWEALGQTLKNRKSDILSMSNDPVSLNELVTYRKIKESPH